MKWDRGLAYEYIYNKLLRELKMAKKPEHKCWLSILLIQLRNGARISEAVRAYKLFLQTRKHELRVKVSKKKRAEERLVIIPQEVFAYDEASEIDDLKLREKVRDFARKRLGINTHSLRYAFVTYLLRAGVSPSIVAKVTHHSRLDFILTYTQEKVAEDLLKSL